MKIYYTYINTLPDGTPFYVGVGTRYPQSRGFSGKHHRAYSKKDRPPSWKAAAINGREVRVVYYSGDRERCHDKERELISTFKKVRDGGTLVNESDGGWNDLKGKKLPQWWRDKISQNVLGPNNSRYGKRGQETPIARLVINLDTDVVFESVTEAADSLGLKMKTLYNMLSGHRPNKSSMVFKEVFDEKGRQYCIDNLIKINKPHRGNYKKVRCLSTGQVYNSAKELATLLGRNETIVRNKLRDGSINYQYI